MLNVSSKYFKSFLKIFLLFIDFVVDLFCKMLKSRLIVKTNIKGIVNGLCCCNW